MKTPLLLLVLLTLPWLTARGWGASPSRRRLAGLLGVTLVFAMTGVGHFVQTRSMAAMLPEWVPAAVLWVHLTGGLELAAAGTILLPRLRRATAWGVIVLLALFLPVNVHAALQRLDFGGHAWGPSYLLIRVPLQLMLGGWIWHFGGLSTAALTSSTRP